MNRRSDTDMFSEDEETSSKEAIDYEAVGTFDSELDKNTSSEILGDQDWKKEQPVPSSSPTISVFDVTAYILDKIGPMTTMKLQKLVYYCQAWSLVWDEKPLFEEKIEAWANGPVVRELFNFHRGMYEISSMPIGNPRLLNQKQRDTIDAVLEYYGDKPAQWLIDLAHNEEPWIQARKGLLIAERGNREIPLDVIADYYSSLPVEEEEDA